MGLLPSDGRDSRGKGGQVTWGYELRPIAEGTRLEHYMIVLELRKGAASLKTMYKVLGLPAKQVAGGGVTLENLREAAEQQT